MNASHIELTGGIAVEYTENVEEIYLESDYGAMLTIRELQDSIEQEEEA